MTVRKIREINAPAKISDRVAAGKERSASADLSSFSNSWYDPGRNTAVRALWFFLGSPLVRARLNPFSGFRIFLMRLFGARLGRGVVIRPGVRVKYPWRLSVGNHCWLGEDVWIDNLGQTTLGDHVCVSQRAYLCTGNHDWSASDFGLIVNEIALRDGSWVGAQCSIGPGVTLHEGAVASFGSVIVRDIPAFEIHAGNPASCVRNRRINNAPRLP